ncbi:MAG: hypothetical protein AB7U63_13625 [Porticoccaceae bacterium]
MIWYLLAILIAAASGIGIFFLFIAVDNRPKRLVTNPATIRVFLVLKVFAVIATLGLVFAALSFGMMLLQQKVFFPIGAKQIVVNPSLALMAFGAVFPAIVIMSFVFSLFPYSPRDTREDFRVRQAPGKAFVGGVANSLAPTGVAQSASPDDHEDADHWTNYISDTEDGEKYIPAEESEKQSRPVRRLTWVVSILFAVSIALVGLGFNVYGYFTPTQIVIKEFGSFQPVEYSYSDIKSTTRIPIRLSNGESSYDIQLRFEDGKTLVIGRYSELAEAIDGAYGPDDAG